MKTSCNGCRVLRKGCGGDCMLRPCLEWIKSPDAQANATVFLAKFYGRAGLFNLLSAGPDHLRPLVFRSLLYEACGRIVNPTFGSVGLLWTESWHSCQTAVGAVLRGEPFPSPAIAPSGAAPAFRSYVDIRHAPKDPEAELLGKVVMPRRKRARPNPVHAMAPAKASTGWCPGGSSTHTAGESSETREGSHLTETELEGKTERGAEVEHITRLDLNHRIESAAEPDEEAPAKKSGRGAEESGLELSLGMPAFGDN